EKGFTPLHKASASGRIEIVRLLIEHGANVEAKDYLGQTPLDVARLYNGREEMIKLLSEHVAK
ncbi:ankyrin repeat-containing domain protein, partial [Russula aff. rugulosa BPL654]